MPTFRVPLAVLLGGVAFSLVLVVTEPPGPGLDPDAVSYVSAARSFAHGGTFRVPDDGWANTNSTMALAHFPPGFPVVLAVPVALGMEPVQGARLVNATAAFVTVALLAWLTCEAAGLGAGLVLAALLLATPAIAAVHENVLSEPLFLTLLAATLLAMTHSRGPLLSGLGAAGAALVRYAGLCAIPAVALWWLVQPGRPRRHRVSDALIAALPGIVAAAAWMLRTAGANREESIREISVYGQLGPTVHEGLATLTRWLAPALDGWWRRIVALAVAGLIVWIVAAGARTAWGERGGRGGRAWRLMLAAGCLALMYAGLVMGSRLFADPGIPLDQRLLAPLLLLGELVIILALSTCWRRWRIPSRVAAALVVTAWAAAAASVTLDDATYALETGNDYADESWAGSSLIAWTRIHDSGRPLFTNVPAALYFHAARMARELPTDADSATLREFADTVRARNGLVVAFDVATAFVHRPDSLLARLPVVELVRLPDGSAYAMGPLAPATPPPAVRPPARAP